jgi:hypothetical protein
VIVNVAVPARPRHGRSNAAGGARILSSARCPTACRRGWPYSIRVRVARGRASSVVPFATFSSTKTVRPEERNDRGRIWALGRASVGYAAA